MFRCKYLLVLVILGQWNVVLADKYHAISSEFIDKLNNMTIGWKAGRNFNENLPKSYFKRLMGALISDQNILERKIWEHSTYDDIPDSYDPRDVYPQCTSLFEIRDQGHCGSCWAIATVSAITDRTCMLSNGTKQFHYSAEDLTFCCYSCGHRCSGGYMEAAYSYWQNSGIVSGGQYGTEEGCQPYEIQPCSHHVDGEYPNCENTPQKHPKCERYCEDFYDKDYRDDKHYASSVYSISRDIEDIKQEVFKFGSVTAVMYVYEDFLSYKSGVYHYATGYYIGDHAMKIIGYGDENDDPYWIVANSWNTDWGDNGFVKIGVDECAINFFVHAGIPEI